MSSEAHGDLLGLRTLGGVIRDTAGNETHIAGTEDIALPQVKIDAKAPELVATTLIPELGVPIPAGGEIQREAQLRRGDPDPRSK